jgi:hypothetical protein
MAATRDGVLFADVLIHEAAHAVVAWELGTRLGQITVDRTRGIGRMSFGSDIAIGRFTPSSMAHRAAAERDMLVYHAGFMAQQRFHYEGTHGVYPLHDYLGILEIAQQFPGDAPVIDAWSTYIEDRARHMIEHPATWSRIQSLALELARRAAPDGVTAIDGETVDRFIAAARVPRTSAFLAYRRREAKGLLLILDKDDARLRFSRAVERAYANSV